MYIPKRRGGMTKNERKPWKLYKEMQKNKEGNAG